MYMWNDPSIIPHVMDGNPRVVQNDAEGRGEYCGKEGR
jgi:hypothetical protein